MCGDRRRRRRTRCLAILATLAGAAVLSGAGAEPLPLPPGETIGRLELDDGVEAVVRDGRRIVLRVVPERGEGYLSLARRIAGDAGRAPAIEAANEGRPLIEGRAIDVPWSLVRDEYRYLALRALFPEDRFDRDEDAWLHWPFRAATTTYGEGLWQVALWFTGDGDNFRALAAANRLTGPQLPRDRPVKIPRALLSALFVPVDASPDGLLTYGEDERGRYAEYRLARGEALYSAVLLRFTVVSPDDFDEAVGVIAERSGIRDVRDIPVGFPIKIPLDLLVESYLPRDAPRKLWAAIKASETAAIRLPERPATLAGVHVILDSGHGGIDLGARAHGIWESDYVYDVACRLEAILEREFGAVVHRLVDDPQRGCRVRDGARLTASQREVVRTTPPHALRKTSDTKVGVNLRWYLANAIYADLRRRGVPDEKVVFLSLHADALHRSLRGGMVYIPGERYRRGRHGVSRYKSRYARYAEYKRDPVVSFGRARRLQDELISRRLAEAILEGYRETGLPVHAKQPIRERIVRTGRRSRSWVPAVLRGNAVPAKVLVETVNLKNDRDAALLASTEGRRKIARALARGLETFFDGS